MAELINRYYEQSKDPMEYCNPLVEKCLREKKSLYDLSDEQVDASVLFHLSPERKNLLLWYPFASEATLLELGAGSGYLSGMLCEKVGRVDSFDMSMENCQLNFIRNSDKENLRVFPGSPFGTDIIGYDYVVVNDDLKNAGRYFPGENPYGEYLSALKKMLKPKGHLLLATGNRLALKYLAGAPDGCSGRYFESVNRYPNDKGKREFSKSELQQLLEENGYFIGKWFYPYPDQTFPNEIFTGESMGAYGYGRKYNNYVPGRVELFREDLLAKDLIREGSMEIHANGFLLDVMLEKHPSETDISYVKLNSDRREEFQIYTSIVKKGGETFVDKKPLGKKAEAHLKKLWQYETNHQKGSCVCLCGEWREDGIRYPFLQGKSLDAMVEKSISKQGICGILDRIHKVVESSTGEQKELEDALYGQEFQKLFGFAKAGHSLLCLRPANIDLILGNVFETDEGYLTIDNEWTFEEWVPKKFILWRSVNELVYAHPAVEDVMSREEIYDYFEITKEEALLFDQWNHHFVEKYVQAEQLHRYEIEAKKISLERDLETKTGITSTLYLDYGEGLSEEHKLQSFCLLEGESFHVTYHIPHPEKVQGMRWDPLEGSICLCQVMTRTKDGKTRLQPLNGYGRDGEWDVFATIDPQYQVETSGLWDGWLTLEGRISYLSNQQLEERFLRPKNLLEKMGQKLERKRQR